MTVLPSLISDREIDNTLKEIQKKLRWTGTDFSIDWPLWDDREEDDIAYANVRSMCICLNNLTWYNLTKEVRFELLCHEACHIVDYWTFYWPQRLKYTKRHYHGPLWRYLMKQLGFKKAKAYLEVNDNE